MIRKFTLTLMLVALVSVSALAQDKVYKFNKLPPKGRTSVDSDIYNSADQSQGMQRMYTIIVDKRGGFTLRADDVRKKLSLVVEFDQHDKLVSARAPSTESFVLMKDLIDKCQGLPADLPSRIKLDYTVLEDRYKKPEATGKAKQ